MQYQAEHEPGHEDKVAMENTSLENSIDSADFSVILCFPPSVYAQNT